MIPDSISALLPVEGRVFFSTVFDESFGRTGDEAIACEVAWLATRSKMVDRGGVLVACSDDFVPSRLFSFPMVPSGTVLIMNHDNGDMELDIVLATTENRKSDGYAFTEGALEEMALQINRDGSSLPDIDHATLSSLEAKYGSDTDGLLAAVRKEKGLFHSIKAAVRDGKLWVRAILDKRYRNHAAHFRKVSIEAFARPTADGKLINPQYVGFTWTRSPQLAGAGVAS